MLPKGKRLSTYIALQLIEKHCSGAVRHRQGPAFSLSHSPCTNTLTLNPAAMQPYAAPGSSVIVSTPVTHEIIWITIHLPEGIQGWGGLVGLPTADRQLTKDQAQAGKDQRLTS